MLPEPVPPMNDSILDPQAALVSIMVVMAAADNEITDVELQRMSDMVRVLPVFSDFDIEDLPDVTKDCAVMLQANDGLDRLLDRVAGSLPANLAETAYYIACDMAAADLHVEQEELRLLQLIRQRLDIDRLTAAAIERGVRARHQTL